MYAKIKKNPRAILKGYLFELITFIVNSDFTIVFLVDSFFIFFNNDQLFIIYQIMRNPYFIANDFLPA